MNGSFVMNAKILLAIALGIFQLTPLFALGANIVIVNGNAPGVGFNDATPAAAVGGNPGLTLGQQRLNAFALAASIWGAQLQSAVDIKVFATMEPLACTANTATLGSAGPRFVDLDFPGAPVAGHWYHLALANKLAGVDLVTVDDDASGLGGAEIRARFNSNLGQPNCLAGVPFYLGLDNNHGTAIDLVVVLLHEFGHGLGFSTVTNGSTGQQLAGFPSIYDKFAFDNTVGKAWDNMTVTERQTSALNGRNVVWTGAETKARAPSVLVAGTPRMNVLQPKSVRGIYQVGTASFGPPLTAQGLKRKVGQLVDQPNGLGLACAPLAAAQAKAVKNKIALVDRGVCTFVVKAKNVQDARARGMIVVDNVAASPPAALGGTDPTIAIPAVRITLADGARLKAALAANVTSENSDEAEEDDDDEKKLKVTLNVDPNQLAGADVAGRVMLFTPNPFQPGSSVSHWDTSATRNLLMEPAINDDLTHSVVAPNDLTRAFFQDLGW
jgi:hypothetical protein